MTRFTVRWILSVGRTVRNFYRAKKRTAVNWLGIWEVTTGRDDPGFLSWFFHWWCWHPVFYRSQLRKSNKTRKLGSWDHDGITMGIILYNPTTVSEFLTLVGLGPALGAPFFIRIQAQLPATFFSLDESPKVQTCCRRSEQKQGETPTLYQSGKCTLLVSFS